MKRLSKLVISLFLVLTLTFTILVKPTLALTVARPSPAEIYNAATSDYDSENDEQTQLFQLAKTVGQTALATVSAASAAAGLSGGAGIMSGLAGAGAIVGGGAVAGISVLGAGPAAVTTMVMDRVLKDDEDFTDNERQARAIGRAMTTAGAAVATAGSVSTIATVGSVTGLSAAGITSGLATIGGVVGGGMAAGAAVTVAAPAVTAAAAGYGAYRIWKWASEN